MSRPVQSTWVRSEYGGSVWPCADRRSFVPYGTRFIPGPGLPSDKSLGYCLSSSGLGLPPPQECVDALLLRRVRLSSSGLGLPPRRNVWMRFFFGVCICRPPDLGCRPAGAIDNSPPFQRWVPIANEIRKPRRGDRKRATGASFRQAWSESAIEYRPHPSVRRREITVAFGRAVGL